MIKVENLTKSFGSVRAVDNLSFEVKKGEIVGFLGPNGAGKTTTLRIIAGFFSPDNGQVQVANHALGKQTIKAQQHIGYLPENNPLYKDMLVSELLNFSADLKLIPKSKRPSLFDFAVAAVAVGKVFYRPIGELSKGYRQRVGLAIALLHQPDILILDEPTEGLDPNQRAEIRALIKNLAKDHTIIMSSHIMQEVQAVCSRLLIINKGKLVADGTPQELTHVSHHEQVILLEIEGEGVKPSVQNLPGAEHIDIKPIQGNRFEVKLVTNQSVELQPAISQLTREKEWTIWKLTEEEHTLEDVFHQLTSET